MAPKRTSLRPTRKNRAAFVGAGWAGVVKSRSEARSLRRFKNGLLDVSRKSGEHLTVIKANSETPLLRLPPEVRNCIWEYALGDKVLDVVFVEKLKGPYIEEKTLIAADTFPDHSHALLQVCRQVYTETALIPFATNAFKFAREEAFDWARHLLPVQQKSIREVHIVTHRAERMLDWMHCDGHEKYMPDAFPLEVFPNVRNIVIKVGYSFIHNFTADDDLTMEKQDELIREYIGKITAYVKEVRPDAKLTFEHVNIKNDKEVDSDYESEGLHSVDFDEI